MKPPDANDLLREGRLPHDPLDGAVPYAAPTAEASDATAAPLPWRTLDEIDRAATANPREWIWPEFLATRTVAFLAGPPKEGKSETAWAFASAVTRGGEWLGKQAPRGYVVALSEEGDHDVIAKASRYGADRARAFVLGRDVVMSAPEWTVLIADAVKRADLLRAADASAPVLLLIDSLGFWAGLEGDEERNEAATRDRVNALQPARMAGLAVLVVHHPVKARDVDGIAALRGSGALAAGVESVGILRRAGSNLGDSTRRLEVFSRIAPYSAVVLERVVPGDGGEPHFRLVGAETTVPKGSAIADEKIVKALAKIGTWVPRSAMKEATGLSDRVLDTRLPALVEAGRVERMGCGARGSPFAYAIPGTPRPLAPDPTTAPPKAAKRAKAKPEDKPPAEPAP